MAKLPESERPPTESIHKKLNEKISRKLQNLFVIDLQNDCGCPFETYEFDTNKEAIHTSESGLKSNVFGRLPLPMKADITEQEVYEIGGYLSQLEKIGCPIIFHCGDCLNTVKKAKLKYAHPLGVDDVAVDYPGSNYIIAHMGYPWHRDAAEVCYKNANVYADISGFVYGSFTDEDRTKWQKVIAEFTDIAPKDKLLFGSDWPISNQTSYMRDTYPIDVQTASDNVKKAFKL